MKRNGREFLKTAGKLTIEGIVELTHIPLLGRLIGFLIHKYEIRARYCSKREDLYKYGKILIENAKRSIISVSSISEEDFPYKEVSDKYSRDYFMTLHEIAYSNKYCKDKKNILRHINIEDWEKIQEALTLLAFGRNVQIRITKLPLEFLIVDNNHLLLGFPTKNHHLFNGFLSADKDQCAALARWIEDFDTGSAIYESFYDLASVCCGNRLAECRDDDCLGRVATKVSNKPDLNNFIVNAFNTISNWYTHLYEGVNFKGYYLPLSDAIKRATRKEKRLSFLDVGCGPAFGATNLNEAGIEYWGIDNSSEMIKLANNIENKKKFIVECDVFAAFMDNDHEIKIHGHKKKFPNKFDIIACQGNTFDFFLGPIQKAFALYLFDNALKKNGILIFTGDKFNIHDKIVERKFNVPGGYEIIEYHFDWAGDYATLKIKNTVKNQFYETLLLHPCKEDWLRKVLSDLGYREISDSFPQWFGPNGGKPYYLWAFQKTK